MKIDAAARRRIGFVMMAVGLLAVVGAVVGLVTAAGDEDPVAAPTPTPAAVPTATEGPEPERTATAPPAPTATPMPEADPTAAASAAPAPEPTTVAEETLDEFLTVFNTQNAAGDFAFALDRLHPVVIDLFSSEQCEAFIASRFASSNVAATGAPSDRLTTEITTSERAVTVDDYFTVPTDLTFQGSVSSIEASYAYLDGLIYWFTTCEAS